MKLRTQRRGRTGRKNKGKMYILITKGTRDEAYYWTSINKEKKMKSQLSKRVKRNIAPKEIVKVVPREGEDGELRPVIFADSREGNSRVLRELDKLNVEIKTMSLPVADYQLSDEVGIERKSTKDFISSIIDKRLYKQARELVENFRKPVIILEGEDLYSSLIHPNAIRGALASLAVDFSIPVIPTRSEEDTAAMLTRIAIREQLKDRSEIQVRTEKKPLTLYEQQLYIIESLPNVGPVTAKKLLEEFGSVKNVINASEGELKKVEGIGDKIAKRIVDVLGSNFRKLGDVKIKKLTEMDEKGK